MVILFLSFCSNTSEINISKNLVISSMKKCVSIRYHFLRKKVMENEVNLEYVRTQDQIVDIFTKDLPKDTFEYLLEKLVVISSPLLN
jgi:isocitrate dehydrogenase